MVQVKKFIFNLFQENCYVVWDDTLECVIIDPGCQQKSEKDTLYKYIEEKALKPKAVLLTHAHMDHTWGVADCIKRYGIEAWMDGREKESLEGFNASMSALGLDKVEAFPYREVQEGMKLGFGHSKIRALSTPGHSMGGLCWWVEKEGLLFSGDTLFAGSIGRTDNRWASLDILRKSLKDTLMSLDGEIDVFPGHGPKTSIGQERLTNPFINEEFGELGYEM